MVEGVLSFNTCLCLCESEQGRLELSWEGVVVEVDDELVERMQESLQS